MRFVDPGSIDRMTLPAGNAGSYYTANRIKKLIKDGTGDWNFRQFVVQEMLYGAKEKDTLSEIQTIHEWTRNHLIYRKDPVGIDLVIGAPKILELLRSGTSGFDCDDMVVFEGTALRVAGIPVDLVILKANPRNTDAWSHIYLIAYDLKTGKAVPLDPIMKGADYPVGWEAPVSYGKKIIPLDGLAGAFGLGQTDEYKRYLSIDYVPSNAGASGNAEDLFYAYLAEKKRFILYLDGMRKAYYKDIAKVYASNEADYKKKELVNAYLTSLNAKEKALRDRCEPREPAGIPNSVKIDYLTDQNQKFLSLLQDLQEIKRVIKYIEEIGQNYLSSIKQEEIKLAKRNLRRQRRMAINKLIMDGGAIALQFVPAVGVLLSAAGSVANEMVNMNQKERHAIWLQGAIEAINIALGPGTSEVYAMNKVDDIKAKVESLEAILPQKIKINEELIRVLSSSTSSTMVKKSAVVVNVNNQGNAKVAAAGIGAAILLSLL